ncbi:hypothetical protein [Rossellomorea sp. NPDC077527]|uniref:hypothetical protein n=1 Tax=Rossellomorea sp. NPDC077527 TaxID=3364510 RepID=UPI0037C766C0
MENHKLLIMIVLLVLLFSGCAASKKEVKIAGNVKTVGNKVSVNGTSTLEKNSEIKVELKDIESDAVLEEAIVKVNADRTYSANFSRENRDEEQKLVVTFKPEEQPADIQKIYGPKGENIGDGSPGLVKEGEFARIQMFDFIYKVEKGSVGQRTFLLDTFNNLSENSSGGE